MRTYYLLLNLRLSGSVLRATDLVKKGHSTGLKEWMALNIKDDEVDEHWPMKFVIILRHLWKSRNGHAFDIFEFMPHDRAGFLDGEFTEILEAVIFKDTCNSK